MNKKKLPKGLLELASYYSGDEAWKKFSDSLPVDEESVKKISLKFNVATSLAKALEWHIGLDYVEDWLNQNVPALDEYKPSDLLENYANGEVCLREILMRMH